MYINRASALLVAAVLALLGVFEWLSVLLRVLSLPL